MHARHGEAPHAFQYPIYFYALNLDELGDLDRRIPFFSHNRPNLVSFHDRDYLRGYGGLKGRLLEFLEPHHLEGEVAQVLLVTSARYFNYVFNPVSFYYCLRLDGSLAAVVAEVNNTFGERHVYVLPRPEESNGGFGGKAVVAKSFHVSPFNKIEGDYEFWFSKPGETIDIHINILERGRAVFRSRLWGKATALDSTHLARTLLKYPLSTALTIPRILWQAARLKFQKGLPVFTKPYAGSEYTLRGEAPGPFQRLTSGLVLGHFNHLKKGRLSVTLPDRRVLQFGLGDGIQAQITVGNWAFFRRLLSSGDIGLGESFQEGEWTSPDLTAVLEFFGDNLAAADQGLSLAWIGRKLNRWLHLGRANTLSGSKKNIEAHYDLGNEHYSLFLDAHWMYSSAIFASEDESLDEAQERKIGMILAKAKLRPGLKVLEIGSGWGSLAIAAAKLGCQVTSITLSQEQLKLARQRAKEAGEEGRVEFLLRDYRDIEGTFDRVLSVEMLEAVGHEYLGRYFRAVDRALAPGGRAVIQVISVPDERYQAYRQGCDWIQKHVFPGAVCPSPGAMQSAMAAHSRLKIEHSENIGPHYPTTLNRWKKRLLERASEVKALGFDERFLRTWEYYFSYCEAGFRARLIQNYQLVLNRAEREAS
jgi:cyclopropane-fatty-acyl-phospholipid synthase